MTAGTIEYLFRQGHFFPMSTPAACLAGIGRIDFDERPASLFRFAGQLSKERRPRRIMNALGQTMVMGHAVDMQIFYTDDPVRIDDLPAFLMGEVLPSPRDTLMDSRHSLPVLPSLRCTLGKFGVLPIDFCEGFLFLTKKARVLYF